MNPNHPKPGAVIAVEPIRNTKDIKALKMLLRGRNLCLFTIGINTNLRASDLVSLKVSQVLGLKAGDSITLKEKKTGKSRRVTLNSACIDSIPKDLNQSDYLFKSQRGEALTVPSVSRLVKSWCSRINLKGNYAAHTLRKTWGYHQRVTFKVDIPTLMVCFNHSTQRQTLEYLCIQPSEIKDVYMNEL